MNYNYLVNLIIIINIVLTFSANIPLAGKAFKKKLQPVLTRANSYLQSTPKTISTIILFMIILGLFGIGKVSMENETLNIFRIISAALYVLFSWIQIYSIRELDEFYSPDIVIYKGHQLIEKGFYRITRHPVYLSQILQDLFAGIALLSIPVLIVTLFVEIPLYIKRANLEEKFLESNLKDYSEYKRRVGKWFPKIF